MISDKKSLNDFFKFSRSVANDFPYKDGDSEVKLAVELLEKHKDEKKVSIAVVRFLASRGFNGVETICILKLGVTHILRRALCMDEQVSINQAEVC